MGGLTLTPKLTIAIESGDCFYCGGVIKKGDPVYENESSYSHPECYNDEYGEYGEDPDTGEDVLVDTEGIDGGDDD